MDPVLRAVGGGSSGSYHVFPVARRSCQMQSGGPGPTGLGKVKGIHDEVEAL